MPAIRGVNKFTLPADFQGQMLSTAYALCSVKRQAAFGQRIAHPAAADLLVLGKDGLEQGFGAQITHRAVTVLESVMQTRTTDIQRTAIEPWRCALSR